MSRRYTLKEAVKKAKSIRRELRKIHRANPDLQGLCGLASIMLAVSLKDVWTLRMHSGHAWNEIGASIIDITAAQFNEDYDQGILKEVLVTRKTMAYHEDLPQKAGPAAYRAIVRGNWYDYTDHPKWDYFAAYWSITRP